MWVGGMDQGRPSDREILNAVSEEESPVLNTSELARIFGYSPAGMGHRLKNFDYILINSRDCGGVTIWWITEKGEAYLAGDLDSGNL